MREGQASSGTQEYRGFQTYPVTEGLGKKLEYLLTLRIYLLIGIHYATRMEALKPALKASIFLERIQNSLAGLELKEALESRFKQEEIQVMQILVALCISRVDVIAERLVEEFGDVGLCERFLQLVDGVANPYSTQEIVIEPFTSAAPAQTSGGEAFLERKAAEFLVDFQAVRRRYAELLLPDPRPRALDFTQRQEFTALIGEMLWPAMEELIQDSVRQHYTDTPQQLDEAYPGMAVHMYSHFALSMILKKYLGSDLRAGLIQECAQIMDRDMLNVMSRDFRQLDDALNLIKVAEYVLEHDPESLTLGQLGSFFDDRNLMGRELLVKLGMDDAASVSISEFVRTRTLGNQAENFQAEQVLKIVTGMLEQVRNRTLEQLAQYPELAQRCMDDLQLVLEESTRLSPSQIGHVVYNLRQVLIVLGQYFYPDLLMPKLNKILNKLTISE